MTFEEYADKITWRTVAERTKAKAVWEQAYKQGYKDGQAAVKQMEMSDERNEKRWLQEKQELKDEIDVLIMKIAILENAL